MKISLTNTHDLNNYTCTNEKGHTISLSNGSGVGPMQSVLMAAAACSTIDIVMILEKMRQDLKSISVEAESERREEIPRTFTKIHLHYILEGELKEEKVKKAIDSSLEKYCSVSKMLEKSAEISSSFEII